jgi:hypothetical protein
VMAAAARPAFNNDRRCIRISSPSFMVDAARAPMHSRALAFFFNSPQEGSP